MGCLCLRDEEPKVLMGVSWTSVILDLFFVSLYVIKIVNFKLGICESAMHHIDIVICHIIFILHVYELTVLSCLPRKGWDVSNVTAQQDKWETTVQDSVSPFKNMKSLDIFKGAIVAVCRAEWPLTSHVGAVSLLAHLAMHGVILWDGTDQG